VIKHIHAWLWTEPARRRNIIQFLFLKLILHILTITRVLFRTANSCWTIFVHFITIDSIFTELNIPVICDVEIRTFNDYIYRWHCLILINQKSFVVIIYLIKIHSLIKLGKGPHCIDRIEDKCEYYEVSDQWATTPDCSLVLVIPAVVDFIRC